MAIYIGHEGVVRKCQSMDGGYYAEERHILDALTGIDGVTRHVMQWSEQLSHLEIDLNELVIYTLNSDGNTTSSLTTNKVSDINEYGSLTVTSNSIQIYCSKAGYDLNVNPRVRLVFKDGHRVSVGNVHNTTAQISFTVGYSLGFRGDGFYTCYFCGYPVYEGHVNNSVSGTKTIGPYFSMNSDNAICSAATLGSYAYVQQTYQSCTIGGKSFPIKVINNLK